MLKRSLLLAVKKHPAASALYSIYILIWLGLVYLTYYFLVNVDFDTIQAIVFYWFVGFCIPYLTFNIILSYQHRQKRYRRFYSEISTLIFMPMGIALLVLAAHGVVAYFNKGI